MFSFARKKKSETKAVAYAPSTEADVSLFNPSLIEDNYFTFSAMAGVENQGASGATGGEEEGTETSDGAYECNICLDQARDAVVSMCGHLFW